MEIKTAGHIEKISGAHSKMVYSTKKSGRTFVSNRNTDVRKKSSEQRTIQNFLTRAARNWKTLSVVQRKAWLDYGKLYFTKDNKGRKVTVSGLATYVRANSIRQVLGLALITDAPTLPPPDSILSVEQVGGQNPDSIGLTIMHTITNTANLSLLVRMTPAGTSVADDPADNQYYFVCGVRSLSAQALPANGSDVTFSPTKFLVNDGERYGVEIRVVRTTDGLLSEPIYGDFNKLI